MAFLLAGLGIEGGGRCVCVGGGGEGKGRRGRGVKLRRREGFEICRVSAEIV